MVKIRRSGRRSIKLCQLIVNKAAGKLHDVNWNVTLFCKFNFSLEKNKIEGVVERDSGGDLRYLTGNARATV